MEDSQKLEMLRKEIRRLAKKKMKEGKLNEGGVVNWMLDKVRNFVANHFNSVADYQYARLMNSPDFRALHKKFGMSEKEFMSKATAMVKKDPKKFADILAYDVRKGSFGKYFK